MDNFRKRHSDYWLSLAVFGLIVFGLIMIYSVSKYYSLDITNNQTDKYYLTRQFVAVIIGLVVWIVFQAIDYRFWQRHAGKMLFITAGLLLLPLILAPFGLGYGGRWINLGIFPFQPAEVAKLTFILYLAGWFSGRSGSPEKIGQKFWPFIAIVGFIALLMLIQKDLGTLVIFVVAGAGMFAIAGAPVYQLISGGGLAALLIWLAIKLEPYRMERFLTFLNPEKNSLGSGYHIQNALIAIGSGGLWGLGFGQSKQKYLYLPEAHTDSIFAIICEELGMLRAFLVIAVFVFIALRGLKIAKNAPDVFSRLAASGIIIWLFSQMIINIGAMFSLIPLTGVTLPLISYGGSSLIALLAGVGVLNNIAKYQVTNGK